MSSPRTTALSLLSGPRASGRVVTGPQIRLAQEVSLLGSLQGSLSEAERQGDIGALARLAPLVAARADKIAAMSEQSGRAAVEGMSDEALMAELRELREKQAGWEG